MKIITNGTITDVKGFKAAGIATGVRKNNRQDLALIYSEQPAVAAGVFTQNLVKAAPVLLDLQHIHSPNTQAIIINSGNANACTGQQGMHDAEKMVALVAEKLNLATQEVLVESTGVIGVPMDMQKIEKGIAQIIGQLSPHGGHDAATAIRTTDTTEKQICVEITIDNKPVRIAGIAKGSGMIHPNMATMLSFITTDVSIEKSLLQQLFSEIVEDTYNMISVDGDTSTNDAAIVLANGLAGNQTLNDPNQPDSQIFKQALHHVNQQLAILIAQDGEGATKLIEIKVNNAHSLAAARKIAKSVITSSLFKSAMFGGDANWGRILCAMGYSGAIFNSQTVDITIQNEQESIQVAQGGMGVPFDETLAAKVLSSKNIHILIDLHDGPHHATAWGCDLSYDYVKINADYRS